MPQWRVPPLLIFNTGSASLKFELIEASADPHQLAQQPKRLSGILEHLGDQARLSLLEGKRTVHQEPVPAANYAQAARLVLDGLSNNRWGHLPQPQAVGHRVVHGGPDFGAPARIDDDVVRRIEALEELAPLHNQAAVEVIQVTRSCLDLPMAAVFDTVFHRTMPPAAHTYALPLELAQKHGVRRYGFHGLSHEYLARRFAQLTGQPSGQVNLVTMHLESGCSACAIHNGCSVDTSMGFTPLEGLVMGKRSGDLDPAILSYLAHQEQTEPEQIEQRLNQESGLLGLSGVSSDTRELMAEWDSNPRVRLAMDVFCHRLRQYVGAYLATLGGAQAVVFGGGIGEDTPLVRSRVAGNMEWCGLHLDEARNAEVKGGEACLSPAHSAVQAWVIATDEGAMIAQHTLRTLRA